MYMRYHLLTMLLVLFISISFCQVPPDPLLFSLSIVSGSSPIVTDFDGSQAVNGILDASGLTYDMANTPLSVEFTIAYSNSHAVVASAEDAYDDSNQQVDLPDRGDTVSI